MGSRRKETLSLAEAVTHLLEECRMVLPGVQALFGFQLIAVFNTTFRERLTPTEQTIHLVAIGLVAMSVALVMAPAAYHRQTNPEEATESFIELATYLLLGSMFPLMIGITLDFYLIARLIVENNLLCLLLSIALLIWFVIFWFVLPQLKKLRNVGLRG
jgi:uncharacterized membrane protein